MKGQAYKKRKTKKKEGGGYIMYIIWMAIIYEFLEDGWVHVYAYMYICNYAFLGDEWMDR